MWAMHAAVDAVSAMRKMRHGKGRSGGGGSVSPVYSSGGESPVGSKPPTHASQAGLMMAVRMAKKARRARLKQLEAKAAAHKAGKPRVMWSRPPPAHTGTTPRPNIKRPRRRDSEDDVDDFRGRF